MREAPFYVGWQERAPPASARFVRRVVAVLLAVLLALAFSWAGSQRTWQPSAFEFGRERDFTGTYRATPVPHLSVARPGAGAGETRWLLVRPGKHGADPEWASLDGRAVRLAGSLVFRGEGTMIEVVPGSLRATGQEAPAPARVRSHGRVQLAGEIVDSKCWLGVMNPGNLRTHRACATLCVRGGIPPLLVVRTPEAGLRQAVLVGPSGELLNHAVLDWIAVPVTLEGELEQHDDLWVLRVDPVTIRALGP